MIIFFFNLIMFDILVLVLWIVFFFVPCLNYIVYKDKKYYIIQFNFKRIFKKIFNFFKLYIKFLILITIYHIFYKINLYNIIKIYINSCYKKYIQFNITDRWSFVAIKFLLENNLFINFFKNIDNHNKKFLDYIKNINN